MSHPQGRPRALVTGAGVRLGRAIATALAEDGYDLALHYRQSAAGVDAVARSVRARGGSAVTLPGDLAEPGVPGLVVTRAVAALGGLDILVASAANYEAGTLSDADEARWDGSFDLNARATVQLVRAAAPHLVQARGLVIVLTCTTATRPDPAFGAYSVSKAAARHAVRTLALELAPHVRVNGVAPGSVLLPSGLSDAERARLLERIPLGRFGSPDDIVRAVRLLVRTPFATGAELVVDGGRSVAAS